MSPNVTFQSFSVAFFYLTSLSGVVRAILHHGGDGLVFSLLSSGLTVHRHCGQREKTGISVAFSLFLLHHHLFIPVSQMNQKAIGVLSCKGRNFFIIDDGRTTQLSHTGGKDPSQVAKVLVGIRGKKHQHLTW